jgi:PAS domain S-box-containing protein
MTSSSAHIRRVLLLSVQHEARACFEEALVHRPDGRFRILTWIGDDPARAKAEIEREPADLYIFDLLLGSALTDLWRMARARHDGRRAALTLLSTRPEQHGVDIERGVRGGAADVFTPPWHPPILAGRIERLLIATAPPPAEAAGWYGLFANSRAPQLLLDPQTGAIRDANAATCAFYGYDSDTLRTLTMSDLEIGNEQTHLETTSSFRHRRADGAVRDVKLFTTLITLDGAAVVHHLVQDNTKRREAQETAQSQRSLVNALRSTANMLLTTFDRAQLLDGILAYMRASSPTASVNIMLIDGEYGVIARALGYDPAYPVSGLRFRIADTPNLRRMVASHQPDLVADTYTHPDWIVNDLNMWIRSHLSAPLVIQGEVVGFLSLDNPTPNAYHPRDAEHIRAMADQVAIALHHLRLYEQSQQQAVMLEARVRERTEALHAEHRQLTAILDSMRDGVLLAEMTDDMHVRVRYVNRALEHAMGYGREMLASNPLAYFQPPHHTAESYHASLDHILHVLTHRPVHYIETRLTRADGSLFDVAVTFTRVDTAEGVPRGIVVVVRDISRERALRDERARFVAFASHEMRTPITNMKTRLYLLRRQPEKTLEHLEIMESVVERMRRLVDDLLDVNRFERGTIDLVREEYDLGALVDQVVQVQRPEIERAGLQVVITGNTGPLRVYADRERIIQAVTAVINNAVNYTPSGGRIAVMLQAEHTADAGFMAVVTVEDTGIGIAPEHLPHIFEPFYRVASAITGTGLGLTIVREIVRLHGGDVHAASTFGAGTAITLRLPVATPMLAHPASA